MSSRISRGSLEPREWLHPTQESKLGGSAESGILRSTEVHASGTMNVLNAARQAGTRCLVFVSSFSVCSAANRKLISKPDDAGP